MKADGYNSNQSFQGVYVKSSEAAKLLRKADRAVKASDAVFVDVNGHRKPLWSVLFPHITKSQQDNNNNIIIDMLEKGKNLLAVKLLDNKGFVHKKWIVNPMPVTGKMSEIFTSDTIVLGSKTADATLYGRSAFFDVIDNAAAEADLLKQQELASLKEPRVSVREYPKTKRINKTQGRLNHITMKRAESEKLKEANKKHVQRPFLKLKELFLSLELSRVPKAVKAEPKIKTRIPRQLKKELKKSKRSSIN